MASHFGVLLAAAVSDPGSPIARLPLLTESERRQAILDWNQTSAESSTLCVHELFETWAELTPDAVAVTSRNGLLTYGQLNRSSNRLGSLLRESGAKPDTVVAIRIERGLEMVVGMLGILKAGAAFVPLDPAYPESRLDFMLEDSGAPLLLATAGHGDSPGSQSIQVIPIREGTYDAGGDGDIKLSRLAEPSDLAYVIYTSGSTGTLKGVGIQHGSLLNLVEWHQRVYQVSRHDRATQLAALSFDACAWEIWPYLAAGASLHVLDDEARSSVPGLIDWLVAEQITICFLPTPLAEAAIESGLSTPGLRLLLTGGDRLSKVPSNGLPYGLVNNYGPTETTVVATWHPVRAGLNGDSGAPPIGLPIANTQVYLLDSSLEPAPVGHPAEVHIAGRGLARYYLGHPELTADKFVPVPFGGESGARMYRSGDLARRKPDGNIDYLGRIDAQVKVRGFRVEPAEIEAVLGQHPSRLVEPAGLSAPSTPVEEILTGLWGELLGIKGLGVRDNFFEVGGHSLLAARMISRLRGIFSIDLPVRIIFERPTVLALAEYIERERLRGHSPITRPVQRVSRSGRLPLSFTQERLWFLDQLEPGSAAYNMPAGLRMAGKLNGAALEAVLNEIVSRHEVLRTRFASPSGQPVQLIDGAQTGVIPLVDLSALAPDEAEDEGRDLAQAEARRSFDLLRGPLIRASLLHIGSDTHILLLTLQHIICDGWSVSILTREMTELYPALSAGTPVPLPELQVQYADYACWQRETLNSEAIEPLISYWRDRLTGLEPIQLYGDRPRPAVQSSNGGDRPLVIPAQVGKSVAALSRRQGATEFMTLLAAFQTLLLHYTGQQDIAVGSSIAGRTTIETEPLIGCFLNTLVLRSDMAGNPSFLQVLGRVRETALGAYANQDAPIEVLLDVLQPERSMGFNPLVQAMFILQNTPKSAMRLGALDLDFTEFRASAAKFDLTLDLTPEGEGFIGRMEYNADLFDAESIDRMNGHFLNLLESFVTDPGRRIWDAGLLSHVERSQLLEDWSVGAKGRPAQAPVHQNFEALAEASPQAIAVVFDSEHLSYGELNFRANQLAWHLRRLGVGPEARVGICLDRSPELITGLFGILKSGGAYVPIDHTYPIGRKESMLRESSARALVSKQGIADELAGAVRHAVRLDTDWSEVEINPGSNPDVRLSGENLAYVIYTSGSTGSPKGTGIEHRSIAAFSETAARRYKIGHNDRVLQFASISFDASAEEIFPCLTSGAALVLRTPSMIDSVAAFLRLSRNWNLTVLDLPTAYWNEVTQELAVGLSLPDSVRLVIIGGERAVSETLDMWRRCATTGVDREVELINSYGPTEATVVAALCRLSDSARAVGLEVPIGRAIDNVSVYTLNPELEPSPIGVAGEMHIGGAGIARGYEGNPHITADKFVPDPHSRQRGSRLYKTGDLARFRRDGYIEFLGRTDDQVKVRGYRIELGEVEAALNACPEVKQAVVLPAGGRANTDRLVAYIVSEVHPAPAAASLRAFVGDRLPAYMVPAFFTILDEMPVLPSGKVDRRRLPAVHPGMAGSGKPGAEPRGPVEEVLAAIFAEVLGVDHVGVEDSFFELGGHSLIATQLVARVREALGVELPLRSVFESPAVAALAERIEAAAGRGDSSAVPRIEPAPRTGPLPLSFAQERIWFLSQLDPGGTQYHVPRAVRIEGPLNAVLLDHAFSELMRRHEILRTSFPTVAEQPVQVTHGGFEIKLPVIDVTSGGGLDGGTIWPMIIQEANQPFDLSNGPMVRLRLLRLGEREHILLMVEHHLVHDGWTQGVFVRDFLEIYDAFSRGDRAPRPDLSIQYADFAYWQRQWLRGEALEKQLGYWRQRLAGMAPVLELPADRPRPAVQSFLGDQVTFALDADLAESLRALARRNQTTLYMAMLSSFNLLLSRWSGRQDIIVGSGIANRRWREIEGMLGMIINTLVLRTDISGCGVFRDLLAVQREVCLEAYAHQDAPFEKVVEALQPSAASVTIPFSKSNTPSWIPRSPNSSCRGFR
jgi:amino acid adenylation domain-containing protein